MKQLDIYHMMIYIIYFSSKILITDCKLRVCAAEYPKYFTSCGKMDVKIKLGEAISTSSECFAGSSNQGSGKSNCYVKAK